LSPEIIASVSANLSGKRLCSNFSWHRKDQQGGRVVRIPSRAAKRLNLNAAVPLVPKPDDIRQIVDYSVDITMNEADASKVSACGGKEALGVASYLENDDLNLVIHCYCPATIPVLLHNDKSQAKHVSKAPWKYIVPANERQEADAAACA
jgi:hypothetical protein